MLKASDFEGNVVFGGEEGKAAPISDIRVGEVGDFTILNFYVDVNSRLKGTMVDEGFEHQDASEIEVKMWIPTDAKGQEAKEKKIKANNKVLAHLSGEVVDPLDEEAWMQALPGGNLHDAIKEKAAVHVKNNEYNGNKNWQFEFNAAKPKVQTLEEFKRQYQLKKVQREAEQVDLG